MKPQTFSPSNSVRARIFPVLCATALALAALAATVQAETAKITHQFELPPFSYTELGYTQEQIDEAAGNGLAYTDRPGIASGLQQLVGGTFLAVTDRGPNFTVTAGRVFPLPDFTPTIVLLKTVADRVQVKWSLPIVANDAGDFVTGIPIAQRRIPCRSPMRRARPFPTIRMAWTWRTSIHSAMAGTSWWKSTVHR
jgi:hypothetical protein